MGAHAISLDWQVGIDPHFHDSLIQTKKVMHELFQAEVTEIVLTYQSLLICLKPDIPVQKVILRLQQFDFSQAVKPQTEKQVWRIPVNYGSESGKDLKQLAEINGMEEEAVIDLHSSAKYRVYFTGFMPGFLYLGGLPEAIHTPRKKNPEIRIPAGSVAIGGQQTGIYPQESPGGWHIIGHTPLPVFSIQNQPPSPFQPGDEIHFEKVNAIRYRELLSAAEAGQINLKDFKDD